jgi:hypothetical protein
MKSYEKEFLEIHLKLQQHEQKVMVGPHHWYWEP